MKHLQKLKATGVPEVEDRGEAVRKIRPTGRRTRGQLNKVKAWQIADE